MKKELMNCRNCGNRFKGSNNFYCKLRYGNHTDNKDIPKYFEKKTKTYYDYKTVQNEERCSLFEQRENKIKEAYLNIIDILKNYCDLKEEYYSLIAIWIIGTYFHNEFESYPYLFFNAMKGSGKSRILRLISVLGNDGRMLNSLTETILFRTKGLLCIDEFEGASRKGNENLMELLNSAYKKGINVIRYKKVKGKEGEEQQAEEFKVYRPLTIANIWGMGNVLADRCFELTIEKSNKKNIIKKVEMFEHDLITHLTKKLFSEGKVVLGGLGGLFVPCRIGKEWNKYQDLRADNTPNTPNTPNQLNTPNTPNYDKLFDKLERSNIDGRHLELSFPLFLISQELGDKILNKTIETIQKLVREKKEQDQSEDQNVRFYDFISQEIETNEYISAMELTKKFKEFLQTDEPWINEKWVGKSLKRLSLLLHKKTLGGRARYLINYKKAQEKIKMFK